MESRNAAQSGEQAQDLNILSQALHSRDLWFSVILLMADDDFMILGYDYSSLATRAFEILCSYKISMQAKINILIS
ncbi:hypothetical protein Dimus_020077 [Dionaea muscipula]